MTAKWRSYDIIQLGHDREQDFRDGVKRNGSARDRCPFCDGRRLHREQTFAICPDHAHWFTQSMWVACHPCRLRWGVLVGDCEQCSDLKAQAS